LPRLKLGRTFMNVKRNKSEVFRTHKQLLKKEVDRKRRDSTAVRRRQNNREGEEDANDEDRRGSSSLVGA
jgi:hypothetical protein